MTIHDRVKNAIKLAIGAERLDGITPHDNLIENGIISSLEIVIIGLALEKEFQVTISDNEMTTTNFSNLAALTALMQKLINGTIGPLAAATQTTGLYYKIQKNLESCLRHFLIFPLFILLLLLAIDQILMPLFIEKGPLSSKYSSFSDFGKRLYRSVGSWSPDDLRVAVNRHELFKENSHSQPSIMYFGDSGTFGSWGKAEDAPPAHVEEKLKETLPNAKVHNFAYFMPSFTKDSMLLEASIEKAGGKVPADIVIFTLSDAYFNKALQDNLIDRIPYFSLNRDLLVRFYNRIKTKESTPPQQLLGYLGSVNRLSRNKFEEYILNKTSIYHYKAFFSFLTSHGKDSDSYWETEYLVGNKPLYQGMQTPPSTLVFQDGGFASDFLCGDCVKLTDNTLNFLNSKGVKVFIVLRPSAPIEWRNYPRPVEFQPGPINIDSIIKKYKWNEKAKIIDLRWALHANEFSDSISHYTPAGRKILGDIIGGEIANNITNPIAMNSTSKP